MAPKKIKQRHCLQKKFAFAGSTLLRLDPPSGHSENLRTVVLLSPVSGVAEASNLYYPGL